jgi:hypothetical protein
VELGDLNTHLNTEFRVEVGQRLVHEEYLRVTYDSTAESNTLTLTTGESLRLSVEEVLDLEDLSSFLNTALDLITSYLTELKTESHVIEYCHVRIQSVVLENHRDITVLRENVIDETIVDVDLTLGDIFETSDHTKGGGLTATGRSYQDDEFLIGNLETEVRYSHYAAVILLKYMLK